MKSQDSAAAIGTQALSKKLGLTLTRLYAVENEGIWTLISMGFYLQGDLVWGEVE